MKVCTNCGQANGDDAMFCAACNHFLEWTEVKRLMATGPATEGPDGAGSLSHSPAPAAGSGSAEPGRPPVAAPPLPSSFPARAAGSPPVTAPVTGLVTAPAAAPTRTPAAGSSAGTPVDPVLDQLRRSRRLADEAGRPDLVTRVDEASARLTDGLVSVVVVGEFKRGKSTLVNALLQTAVCPADADLVTVVPTIVRYGAQPKALGYLERSTDRAAQRDGTGALPEPEQIAVPLDAIADFASETGNPGNRKRLRSVEVQLAHRMLRTGLSLVDTPGVGGLDSAHGLITMSALDLAQAVLFVTDASTELTEPEVEFLRRALERCPLAACVITKTDLYPEWRRIVELDRGHLADAGIDLPVIAVSSFLRLGSRRDPELTAESGYPALVEFLGGTVMTTVRAGAGQAASAVAGFVADQLNREVVAVKAVIQRPERAGQVVEQLRTAVGRAASLASASATWQQVLGDGLQDLVSEIEHDLAERLRTVLRDVEAVIDDGDPKQMWDGIGVWLRRQVVEAAVANYDTLSAAAAELAAEVGRRFSLDAGEAVVANTGAPPESLSALALAPAASLSAPGGRLGTILLSTRTAAFVPMVLFGMAGSLLGVVIIAPISVALAAGIGRKMIKDENKRQVAYRRQQAKNAARKYVEEVGFVMNKETRDALRRTGRQLRDEFTARATTLHRSTDAALAAAESARALDGAGKAAKAAELDRRAAELAAVRRPRADR